MTDRASEIIARIVRLKHGPNGTGRDGPCDPDCTKCALEKELETVKADCAAASHNTACEEQRDVYRDRAQQLAGRVTDLERQLDGADRDVLRLSDDRYRLRTALRSLIVRVRRTGGYASPEEQAALWEAERVLGER